MIGNFHFLRPLWWFACVPLVMFAVRLFRQKSAWIAWSSACDSHLLPHLMQKNGESKRMLSLCVLFGSALCMITGLSGPTWSRYFVPTYQQVAPRVFVLDLSDAMLQNDIQPDRLTRAKFKLHDLLQHHDAGQFGLVVYTSEPFVVSPLTEDGQTIDALLSSLTPNIMPVKGNRLESALEQAQKLLQDAGSSSGEILVFTATLPSEPVVNTAEKLAQNGYFVSVLPILDDKSVLSLFLPLARAGQGDVIAMTDNQDDIETWLRSKHRNIKYEMNDNNDIPVWRDEGRWFLIPALLLLLPAFRRDWLLRITT